MLVTSSSLHGVVAIATHSFPVAFVAVYGVGFLAAVFIGLIALYNSKRPPGLEDAERPSIIPKLSDSSED